MPPATLHSDVTYTVYALAATSTTKPTTSTEFDGIPDAYDSTGALIFTIVVLLLFGSSILAFIAYSVKTSEQDKKNIDTEVENYLVTKNFVSKRTALDEVKFVHVVL